ncbi:SR-related and CTD-associated factor 4-like isoform X1 [Octopus vulgaris]|uniref:SR-related and CTD-associated factor 4-like isoform X1 n=1 Tax=Octopus vulgaris TaxID=6645 RepID=A0AA36BKG6_OCTVU|nr:SR-related and CTD-associated factor 4-like isoform X1 [Octopus vulgaris]
MEAVRAFNNELSGLYEAKPPVSRAKMAQLTKCAIKAIKFYKHVVQSVEKFIQKCKSEYKVPGLYVIDSIVRQSRHQFGAEKDVFAPRFTKNVVLTFQNLFKCPPDEKSKVVRVLNLWQKNAVFPVEVIQPLLDLAGEPTNPELIASAQRAVDGLVAVSQKSGNATNQFSGEHHSHEAAGQVRHEKELPSASSLLEAQNDMLDTVKQLLQQTQKPTSLSAQQQQLQQLQLLQQQLLQQTELMQQPAQQQQAAAIIDSNLLSQIQTLTNQLLNNQIKTLHSKPPEPGFNKKLLDFDYGESDDEEDKHEDNSDGIPGNVQNILNDPTIMQQIHQMSQTIKKTEQLKNELNMQEQIRQQLLKQQEKEFNQQISQEPPPQIQHHIPVAPQMPPQPPPPSQIIQNQPPPMHPQMPYYVSEPPYPAPPNQNDLSERMELDNRHDRHYGDVPNAEVIVIDDQPDIHKTSRNRDRSRSRSPRRKKRSRSRSRERRRRSRSRDRDRDRDRSDRERDRDRRKRSRSRERERERQREKERERRRKGLPSIKERHLSVCTRTIWLGHIAKVTSEDELRLEIEKYGAVESINMIPPRGCAFVCMARRKDAPKAVEKLKGVKIHSNQLKVAWAPGIGVKDAEYKDMWDAELGVTYIPWEKLPQDLTHLMEGGMIDEDTIPEHLKAGLQLEKTEPTGTNNIEEPQQNFKMNEVNITNPPIAVPPPTAIPPQQPQLQGQPMPRMLMQIPPPTGMMPPMMMPIAPGMPRPPTTGVPPPPLGMAPASTASAVLAPRPVPPVPTAAGVSISLPTMAPTVVLTTVASNNPAMPSLPPPGLVQLPQSLQNNLSSSILATGGISVPPRPPPPNFAAQLRQQPRPFPPQPFPGGPTFRLQVPAPAPEGARAIANVRPPHDTNATLTAQESKENISESSQQDDWLKRSTEPAGDDAESETKHEGITTQTIEPTSEVLQTPTGTMPAISATLQQMLAQRPPPNPGVGMRPPLPPGMAPRPGINGPPTELRLGGPSGPLLTGPPNRATAIGIPGMPAGIAIGPRAISVDGPPPGFPAGRMGLPGGPRFTPRFPPVFPGGPPPRFQGPMGTMLRPPRPDADGRFPANTFTNNGTFDRAGFERAIRPFGPIGPRPDRPANDRWMGRDRWAPRETGPGMRFRRDFDQRDEFFDRSRYVLDNRDPDRNAGGRRMSRFDGEEDHEGERPPHHYEDDRSLHEDEHARHGDDRDRSRRDDERDRLRHVDERDRLRRPDERERTRHDDDRNRLRYEVRDRFRFGDNGREGPEGIRPRNREDRPRKSRWSDVDDKAVETPSMEAPSLETIKAFDTIPENANALPDTDNAEELVAMEISDAPGDVTPTCEELEDAVNSSQPENYTANEEFPATPVADFVPSEEFSLTEKYHPAEETPDDQPPLSGSPPEEAPVDSFIPTDSSPPAVDFTPMESDAPVENFDAPTPENFPLQHGDDDDDNNNDDNNNNYFNDDDDVVDSNNNNNNNSNNNNNDDDNINNINDDDDDDIDISNSMALPSENETPSFAESSPPPAPEEEFSSTENFIPPQTEEFTPMKNCSPEEPMNEADEFPSVEDEVSEMTKAEEPEYPTGEESPLQSEEQTTACDENDEE